MAMKGNLALAKVSATQAQKGILAEAKVTSTIQASTNTARLAKAFVYIGAASGTLTPNAGADQTVDAFSTVTLDGGSSVGATSYTWRQVSGTSVTLNGTGASRTFTAPADPNGVTLVFGLTVTNADGQNSVEDTITVQVNAHNQYKRVGGHWVAVNPLNRKAGAWL